MSPVAKHFSSQEIILFLCALAIILSSFWTGSYFKERQFRRYFESVVSKRITGDSHNLVAPLVGTESPNALEIGRFSELHQDLLSYANEYQNDVESYSVYFRDLTSSQWFGINEDEAFVPASLLKLALAISFLKQEESDASLKYVRKTYTPAIASINNSNPFLASSSLVIGNSYSTDDLLRRMIIDSDNGAKDLLFDMMDKRYFYDIFKLLGIKKPVDVDSYSLSTKDYALFFRMLYNGTYLTSGNSEKLLEILAQTKFSNGLVAGLPNNVTVSHKFGTFILPNLGSDKNDVGLHDCGIIYNENPYILCIMTKGKDAFKLASFIAGLSSIVYGNVQDSIDW